MNDTIIHFILKSYSASLRGEQEIVIKECDKLLNHSLVWGMRQEWIDEALDRRFSAMEKLEESKRESPRQHDQNPG